MLYIPNSRKKNISLYYLNSQDNAVIWLCIEWEKRATNRQITLISVTWKVNMCLSYKLLRVFLKTYIGIVWASIKQLMSILPTKREHILIWVQLHNKKTFFLEEHFIIFEVDLYSYVCHKTFRVDTKNMKVSYWLTDCILRNNLVDIFYCIYQTDQAMNLNRLNIIAEPLWTKIILVWNENQ